MNDKEFFTIDKAKHNIGPLTCGFLSWVKQEFDSKNMWMELLGEQDPDAMAKTLYQLGDANTKAHFKSAKALLEVLPGNSNYLLLCFLKIQKMLGTPHEDLSLIDMENITQKDLEEILSNLGKLTKVAQKMQAKAPKQAAAS
jgi:hypothetical protein